MAEADKMLKSGGNTEAGVSVGKTVARLHGSADNYVQSDNLGTFIGGPVSFLAQPEQIRIAGMWTMNKAMNMMVPSTLGTPNATLNYDMPIKGLEAVMKGAATYMALFGMLQAARTA